LKRLPDGLLDVQIVAHQSSVDFNRLKLDARFQVPDADGRGSSSTQPVTDGGEGQSMDGVTSIEGRKASAFVQVPEHSLTILATRGAERTVRRHANSVNIFGVADQINFELAVEQVPDLDNLVPTSRHNDGNIGVRGKANARNPFLVTIIGDGVLEVTKGVPQVDGAVARSGHDLTVVNREGNRQNILGVTNKAASSLTSVEVPQTEGSIPRTSQSKLTITGDGNILDDVRVASQTALGLTVFLGIGGQLPADHSAITRRRKDTVLNFPRSSDGGDPATMANKFATLHPPILQLLELCYLVRYSPPQIIFLKFNLCDTQRFVTPNTSPIAFGF